jgi:FtsZ-binding cell division protein ZapB
MNSDETIRAQCRAREDYDRLHNTIKLTIDGLKADNEQLSSENGKLSSENDKLISEVNELKKILQEHGITYISSINN